jgi:hypothetical protein
VTMLRVSGHEMGVPYRTSKTNMTHKTEVAIILNVAVQRYHSYILAAKYAKNAETY